jgi:CHAT domain-containing protein
VNLESSHLTDTEIQQFLSGHSEETPEQQRIDFHVAECSYCLQLAVEMQRLQLGFTQAFPTSTEPHQQCPDTDIVVALAAGHARVNARETIHHIVQCDFCGPLLQRCRQDLSQDFSAEEERFLDGLKTSSVQWQKHYVRWKISSSPVPRLNRILKAISPSMTLRAYRLAAVATAVLALAVLTSVEGPVLLDAFQLGKAKELALRAASEQPTIEMRLPNAAYAHYRTEMGVSLAITSPSLREAQSIVLKKKNAGTLDRRWLQVEGLTFLFDGTREGRSKAAIAFERALSDGLDDPSLEIEMAASCFESDKPDVPRTIDLLERVLDRPKLSGEERKAATYDLAIAYENIGDWQNAATKWESYLALDNSSGWAVEARSRLNKAKSKIKILQGMPPSPSPSSFLEEPALQSRVEEYQEIALESWLPQAIQEPNGEAGRASRMLAELLATNHSDPFLRSLLNASTPQDTSAFEQLKSALQKNKTGPYTRAAEAAAKAASLFASRHNLPGELYARFEEVFARQQAVDSETCAALAARLKDRLTNTGYRWLMAHTALERATCLNQVEDYNNASAELQSSRRIEDHNFPVLSLRILGLSAGIHRLQNKDEESWQEGVEGLHRVAEASYPWQRVYQFYSVLELYADKKHYLHAQRALLLRAIAIQDAVPREEESVIVKGTLYGRLSTVYLALKEDAKAAEAATRSNLLLSQAPQDATNARYILYERTGLAEAQRQLGDSAMAVRTLEPGLGLIMRITDKLIVLDFCRVLGDSYRQLHRLDESASIYEAGIAIAEQMLSSVKDEPSRLKWIDGVDSVYRGLILALLDQGKTEDAFDLWEWYVGRTASLPEKTAYQPWKIMREKIFRPIAFPASPTRLIYAAFEDRLQIWTVQDNRIKGSTVKIRQADLERLISEFAVQCASSQAYPYGVDEVRKSGESLAALFLHPVHRELEASHALMVELDPNLSRLPVAALVTADGRYLGEDYAITISPGLLRENKLRAAQPVAPDTSILVVNGAPKQGRDRLKRVEELELALRKAFAKAEFTNAGQHSWNEVSRKLKNRDAFMFVGHGMPQGTNTALVYGGVLLNAKDFPVKTLKRLRFVVLAACSSGNGGLSAFQETGSLVHAFHAAGVPSILVTRWDVDSEATSALLESFFAHLAQREDISIAIWHARSEFRQLLQDPELYRHPHYWAGLELLGRAN